LTSGGRPPRLGTMEPRGRAPLFVLGCLLTALPLPAQEALPKSITVVADEWAPFNMIPGAKPEGYMIDVLREVFEPKGVKVNYEIVPWERALQETRRGTYTAVVGASKSDGEGFVFPTEELSINRIAFVTALGSTWNYTDHSSVGKVSLAVVEGYDYRAWLSAYVKENLNDSRLVQVMRGDHPLENNLRKVLGGFVEAAVDSEVALRWTAKQMGIIDRLRFAGRDPEPAYIYVAFSPALPDSHLLASTLSRGIAQLRSSGRLAALLENYGLKDWK